MHKMPKPLAIHPKTPSFTLTMRSLLRYGAKAVLELDVPPSALVADCRAPRADAIDVAAAVAKALAEPLNFPPLRQAVIPGDRVVVALDSGVPQAASIAKAVVQLVGEAGIESANVCILHAAAE